MSFTHLHSHTHYSLLDGAAKIRQVVNKAAELGMNSLAITDHGNLFGVLEFFTEAKNAGIKPIIGMEAYMAGKTWEQKPCILLQNGYSQAMINTLSIFSKETMSL